jgi:hypothetical protein
MSNLGPNKAAASLSGSLLITKGGARPGQRYDNEVTEVYQSRRRITLSAERVRDVSDFNGSVDVLVAEDETAMMVETATEEKPGMARWRQVARRAQRRW